MWVHRRCSGVKGSLESAAVSFQCKKCKLSQQRPGDRGNDDSQDNREMAGDTLKSVTNFCYLGDMLAMDGNVATATLARKRVAWRKFKELSGVLCGKGFSLMMKGRLYKACVRTALLYGTETWAGNEADIRAMEVTQMKMLRMMCGKTLRDKCTNEHIRQLVKVERIKEVARSHRLRWYGHVERIKLED